MQVIQFHNEDGTRSYYGGANQTVGSLQDAFVFPQDGQAEKIVQTNQELLVINPDRGEWKEAKVLEVRLQLA